MDDGSLEFFFPTNEKIEELEDMLPNITKRVHWGDIDSLSSRSFGYKYYSKNELKGFIVCRLSDETPYIIMNDLVCSRHNKKAQARLIEISEIKIKEFEDVLMIQMVALNNKKLKEWYIKMGYNIIVPTCLKKIMIIQKNIKNNNNLIINFD